VQSFSMCFMHTGLSVKEKMKYVTEDLFKTLESTANTETLMWTTTERSVLLHTPIFDIGSAKRHSTDGREGSFVQILSPDWVNIIPYFIDSKGVPRFIMERQYRHGSETVTLEFPAGLVQKGEDPEVAALRELEEETGLRAHKVYKTGELNPNPAFMTNTGHFYLVEELEDLGQRHLDANEQIDVVTVPVDEVLEKMGTGDMTNGIMLIACFYYNRFRKNHQPSA